jgi:hypothetical protein
MVKKWLPKILLSSLLGGLLLASCLEPVDYGLLAQDERVINYMESKRGLVQVINRTKDTRTVEDDEENPEKIKGGNREIYGLQADRYYMIESEKDKDGNYKVDYPKYVTDLVGEGGGTLDILGNITYVSGGKIYGLIRDESYSRLTNGHTYTIREAKQLNKGWVLYMDDVFRDGISMEFIPSTTDDYEILDIRNLNGNNFTLDISEIVPTGGKYQYVEIPIEKPIGTPAARGTLAQKTFDNTIPTIITQPADSIYDYVFVGSNGAPNNHEDFRVLRVRGEKVDEDKAHILVIKIDHEVLVELNNYTYHFDLTDFGADTVKQFKIEIANAGEFDSFEWWYRGEKISTESEFTLEFKMDNVGDPDHKYLAIGRHVFTAIGIVSTRPYSSNFILSIGYGPTPDP